MFDIGVGGHFGENDDFLSSVFATGVLVTLTHLLVLPAHTTRKLSKPTVCPLVSWSAQLRGSPTNLCSALCQWAVLTFPLLIFCAFDNKTPTWQL